MRFSWLTVLSRDARKNRSSLRIRGEGLSIETDRGMCREPEGERPAKYAVGWDSPPDSRQAGPSRLRPDDVHPPEASGNELRTDNPDSVQYRPLRPCGRGAQENPLPHNMPKEANAKNVTSPP